MAIKHQFNSAKADGPDTTKVRPINWNAEHKLEGGSAGLAVIWDDDDASAKAGLGRFDHFNYTYNGNMEVWGEGVSAKPSGYRLVGAGATAAKDTTNKKYGNASATLTRVGNDCYFVQDVALVWNNLNAFKTKKVALGAWVRSASGGVARIGIVDGVGSTFSSYHTGGGTFEFLKVEHTISGSATGIEIRLQVDTGNASAQFDGVIFITGGKAELSEWVPSGWVGQVGILHFMRTDTQNENVTAFYNSSGASATETLIEFLPPFRGIARRLFAALNSAPAAGQTYAFTLRKATVDTLLTATVTDAGRTAKDITNEVEFTDANLMAMKVISSVTSGARAVHATVEFEAMPENF